MDLEKRCEICNKKGVLQHYAFPRLCYECGELIIEQAEKENQAYKEEHNLFFEVPEGDFQF